MLLAHNHPLGNLEPSQDDIAVTKQLKAAGPNLLPAIRRVVVGDVALSGRMLRLLPEPLLCAPVPAL